MFLGILLSPTNQSTPKLMTKTLQKLTARLREGPRAKYRAARAALKYTPREIIEGLVSEYAALAAQSVQNHHEKRLEWAWTVTASPECVAAIDAERRRRLRVSRSMLINHLFERYLEEWASTQTPRITQAKAVSSIDLTPGQYGRVKALMESRSCSQDEALLWALQFAKPCSPRQSFAIMLPATREIVRDRAAALNYGSMAELVRNAINNAPGEQP